MSESKHKSSFYELSIPERRSKLIDSGLISSESASAWSAGGGLDESTADHMIENVVGLFSLPVGIAQNFVVNGREVMIPMVVEEPSIVAGASFMAKLARTGDGFTAKSAASEMIGQLQLLDLPDLPKARGLLRANKKRLLDLATDPNSTIVKKGGGPRRLVVRTIRNSAIGDFLVVHLIMDVGDVMGANVLNSALEKLAKPVEALTGGRVHLRILSNLSDQRLAYASVRVPKEALAFEGYSGEQVRDGIIEAWAFAAADPYRAATHNKGIMNGIDAVLLATGNDWRAAEAGAHAYAARSGRYTSLSRWSKNASGDLVGEIELPMAVGIVGGTTHAHPTAKANLELLGVRSARELAEIIATVGLAQNMAALRALATEGIQRGHMSLHARQVAISAGASGQQVEIIADQMVKENNIRVERAKALLDQGSIHD
ncbi:MAG: hydroxymethylglutaryl-CoA reductase, degradative [Chloroflexi bacterium]|mgnify:FL=1|nr:hydroxymethylglutaryl-CoA reductase, degradative [Chloroflexota bacterium]